MSLFDASVDLNPHQIEAAMFALKSPISKGVILADEVGLGKTIEAGLVLCQYWAEKTPPFAGRLPRGAGRTPGSGTWSGPSFRPSMPSMHRRCATMVARREAGRALRCGEARYGPASGSRLGRRGP